MKRSQFARGLLSTTFAAVAIVVFVKYEAWLARNGGMPVVDMAMFQIVSFRRGVLVATLFFFTTSFYFLFGLYQQMGRGIEPLWNGLSILPYGIGLFLGPLFTANLVKLRPYLLSLGMAVQVTFYMATGAAVWLSAPDWAITTTVSRSVTLAKKARGTWPLTSAGTPKARRAAAMAVWVGSWPQQMITWNAAVHRPVVRVGISATSMRHRVIFEAKKVRAGEGTAILSA